MTAAAAAAESAEPEVVYEASSLRWGSLKKLATTRDWRLKKGEFLVAYRLDAIDRKLFFVGSNCVSQVFKQQIRASFLSPAIVSYLT